MKPSESCGKPGQERAPQAGQADHSVGGQRAGRYKGELALVHGGRMMSGEQRHAAVGQELAHGFRSG